MPAAAPVLDAAQLAEAFALFSRASEELSTAYAALQAQVGQLSERLSVLMGALPAGVLVVDRAGTVVQANRAAGWQTVPHAHLHVLPRYDDDGVGLIWPRKEPGIDKLRELAARIRV